MELSPIKDSNYISCENRKETSIFLKECDFYFFEWFIVGVIPSYANYGHWGYTVISKEQWNEIFEKIYNLMDLYQKNSVKLFECSEYQNINDILNFLLAQKVDSIYFIENVKKVETWIQEQFSVSDCVCIYGV